MKAAGTDMAVLVKVNMRDGFRGGMEMDETMQVANAWSNQGACALVLSGRLWQGSYVCDAWSDAYSFYDSLYELLVAEVWSTNGREVDDTYRSFQRGLLSGRC